MAPNPKTDAKAPEADPNALYKERFNVLAVRLQRQLHGLQKLAGAKAARPQEATQKTAVEWLERQFSLTVSAMKGNKIPTVAAGPLE